MRIRQYEDGGRIPEEVAARIEAVLAETAAKIQGAATGGALPSALICPCPASLTDLPNPLRRHVEIAIRSVRILAEESRCGSGYAEKKLGELADALQKAAGHAGRLDEK